MCRSLSPFPERQFPGYPLSHINANANVSSGVPIIIRQCVCVSMCMCVSCFGLSVHLFFAGNVLTTKPPYHKNSASTSCGFSTMAGAHVGSPRWDNAELRVASAATANGPAQQRITDSEASAPTSPRHRRAPRPPLARPAATHGRHCRRPVLCVLFAA